MGDSQTTAPLQFEGFSLDLARRCLIGVGGKEISLRPKSFDVLRHLVTNAGHLMTREELMQAVWPGVFVTDDNVTQCVAEIRRALADDAQRLLRTLPRRGYLFVAEVTPGNAGKSPVPPGAELDDRPSLVVLPFRNITGDQSEDYFADGMTDEVTAALSRIPWLLVIARNSAFTYKSRTVDVREVGRDLGVRYVLEGGVARDSGRVRVDAELIESETRVRLWAERFRGDVADLGSLQDNVASRIRTALDMRLVAAESRRSIRARADNPGAVDLVFRARALADQINLDNLALARRLYVQALALDPTSADAAAGAADASFTLYVAFSHNRPDLDIAQEHADRALSIDPNHPAACYAQGLVWRAKQRHELSTSMFERVLELDPNFADAYGQLAANMLYVARVSEVEALAARAMRLSPRDRRLFLWLWVTGIAHLAEGRTDGALGWFRKATSSNPMVPFPHLWLAATHGLRGEPDAGAGPLEEAGRLDPSYRSISGVWRSPASEHPAYIAIMERTLIEGLRRLGLPP